MTKKIKYPVKKTSKTMTTNLHKLSYQQPIKDPLSVMMKWLDEGNNYLIPYADLGYGHIIGNYFHKNCLKNTKTKAQMDEYLEKTRIIYLDATSQQQCLILDTFDKESFAKKGYTSCECSLKDRVSNRWEWKPNTFHIRIEKDPFSSIGIYTIEQNPEGASRPKI